MGNDLLMARVDLTPVLEGHVGPLLAQINSLFLTFPSRPSTPQTNGTLRPTDLAHFTSKSISSNFAMNRSQSKHSTCSK